MPHAFHIANAERAMDVVRLSSERSTNSSSTTKTLPRPVSFRTFSKKSSAESRRAAELEQQAQLQAFLRRHGLHNIHKPQLPKGCFLWRTETMYALHHAVAENNDEMVRLLLAFGADPCQKTSRGRTAAQLAKDLGKAEEIVEHLEIAISGSNQQALELSLSSEGQLVEVHL
ncbi:ANK_REP_REGION domain-containing protein [Durusdinium trenchii]|uniref:ANK_REP_REGION domain-containing protein n=1 Tax=Durusdinium trenchii TaxID=1381693 RepID=A0ABP0LQE1_9DINO